MRPSLPSIDDTQPGLYDQPHRAALKARRVIRWKYFVAVIVGVSAAWLSLMIVDAIVQPRDSGLRWLSFLGLTAFTTILAFRLLPRAFRHPVESIDVARWIEGRRPEIAGKITAAVELTKIDASDVRFGSPELRVAALKDSARAIGEIPWDRMITLVAIKKGLLGLAAVWLIAALFVGFWPSQSVIAFRRIALPWSNEPWPRRDQLELNDLPKAVGPGTALQLIVTDAQPPLPEDVKVELRFPTAGQVAAASIPVSVTENVARAELPPLHQDAEVRAVGGDDFEMSWRKIQVIEVPQWKNHQFEVTLPAYICSGQQSPERTRNEATQVVGNSIEVLSGSRVRFRGELDRAVRAVEIVTQASPNPWDVAHRANSAQVALSGSGDSLLELTESVSWTFRFHLDDETTLDAPAEWRVAVRKDHPPEVVLEASDLMSIAQGAPLAIAGLARDDWGLRDVTAKLTIQSLPDAVLDFPIDLAANLREFEVHTTWPFARDLASQGYFAGPGEQVTIWLEAHDHLGQMSTSQVEHWTILTAEKQLETISSRLGPINQAVTELMEAQRSAQLLARQAEAQWSEQPINQQHIDTLAGVVRLQETIRDRLSGSVHSIQNQIESTLKQLSQNRLADSDLGKSLQELFEQVRSSTSPQVELAWQQALNLESSMTANLGSSQAAVNITALAKKLDDVQSGSLEELSRLLRQVDIDAALARLRRELFQRLSDQRELSETTNQLQLESLRHPSEQTQNQLDQLSQRQRDIASWLDGWTSEVQTSAAQSSKLRALEAEKLRSAADTLAQSQTANNMRTAATNILDGQLGQAVQIQEQIAQSFRSATQDVELTDDRDSRPFGDADEAHRTLSQLEMILGQLMDNQTQLIPQYVQLAERLQAQSRSEEFHSQIAEVAKGQETIRNDLRDVLNRLRGVSLFTWTLEQADEDMARATAAALRGRMSPEAIQAAEDALAKLSAATEAVRQKPQEHDESDSRSESSKGANSDSEKLGLEIVLQASLKLIRGLQLELNRQSIGLESMADSAYRRSRLSHLTRQQEELGNKLDQLLETARAANNTE